MRGMPSSRGARVLVSALAGLLASWGCADFDKAQQEYCRRHSSLCTTYLSDISWLSDHNGFGPVERDRSNGEYAPKDGHTLTLNGITYAKGLGMHAEDSRADSYMDSVVVVDVDLGKPCSTFAADIGVDDEVGSSGSVIFQVKGDDTLLFESGMMTGVTPTLSVNVDLSGRSTLTLIVKDAGDGKHDDHADWANARITCDPSET